MSSWQPRGPPIGRSMRSKVERRMQNETGKTLREVRRAKKIQKKLMTENERLVFNLKRVKAEIASYFFVPRISREIVKRVLIRTLTSV